MSGRPDTRARTDRGQATACRSAFWISLRCGELGDEVAGAGPHVERVDDLHPDRLHGRMADVEAEFAERLRDAVQDADLAHGTDLDHRRVARRTVDELDRSAARACRPGSVAGGDTSAHARPAGPRSPVRGPDPCAGRSSSDRQLISPLGDDDAELRGRHAALVGVRLGAEHVETVQRQHPGDLAERPRLVRADHRDHGRPSREMSTSPAAITASVSASGNSRQVTSATSPPPSTMPRPGDEFVDQAPSSSCPTPTGRSPSSRPR